MKKLFISQPMRGKTDAEIIAEREKAIASVKEKFPNEEIEVIDSFQKSLKDEKPLLALSKSIAFLAQADVAYFCKGWEEARGCRIESQCAIDYDIELVIYDYTK